MPTDATKKPVRPSPQVAALKKPTRVKSAPVKLASWEKKLMEKTVESKAPSTPVRNLPKGAIKLTARDFATDLMLSGPTPGQTS